MRRPPSLDRPAAGDSAAGDPDGGLAGGAPTGRVGVSSTPKPRRARKSATESVSVAPAASDLSTATTEPITLPPLPASPTTPSASADGVAPILPLHRGSEKQKGSGEKPREPGKKTKKPRAKSTTPGTPSKATASARAGNSAGGSSAGDAFDDPVALTPGAARKQLRAATKARKQYERGEVRRFTWRSRRRRRTWLVFGGAIAALVAFVAVGAYSPLMALRTIEVVGTDRIPAEQVQAALSGQIGTPLPIVDGDQIKRELSTFTLIQSYSTESRPPNTLVVRIVERVPVGLLVTPTGFDLVDAAGVVLQSGAERVEGYPVITAANGVGHAGFTAAAAVVRALPESIRTQLDSVTAATTDDVTLTLSGGARIVWGSAERSDYKAVVLASLMVTYPPGSVEEYDVTSPDSAVLR